MACFDSISRGDHTHTGMNSRGGMYSGRYGDYEVSIRNNPMRMGREILIRHQDGFCASTSVDAHDLHHHRMRSGGDPMVMMVEMAVENFERQYADKQHDEMRVSAAMFESEYMTSPNPAAVTRQAHDAEMRIRAQHELREREHWERINATAPAVTINIDTSHTPKKKGKMSGTLREQLQAETDEWLKEVKVA